MKHFITIVAVALIVIAATVAPSFATNYEIVAKPPQIIQFSSPAGIDGTIHGENAFMQKGQVVAIRQANDWLKANHGRIRVISHSVTGNYAGGGSADIHGFSTVTILYEEK